jgi:hypothetical protein
MKHTVVYGSECTGWYLIVAIKKSQLVPFQGRHGCRLTTACTNETHRNKWVRAHGRLSPPYLRVRPAPSKTISLQQRDPNTKNLFPLWRSKRCMIVKYWFRKLKRRPALYNCSLKEYSDKGLNGRLWGEVCEGKDGNAGHYEESQKCGVSATVCAVFYRNDSLPQTL